MPATFHQAMTTAALSSSRLQRRSRWRSPIAPDTVSTLIVSGALLLMPLLAITDTGWPIDLTIALPVLFTGLIYGAVVARSRLGEARALLITVLTGVAVVLVSAALQSALPLPDALAETVNRSADWLSAVVGSGINTDELVFSLLASLLFWLLAYSSSWHLFRLERVWRVVLPPGLILLVNIAVFGGDAPLDRYLLGFLLMALVLLVRSNLNDRRWQWRARGFRFPLSLFRQTAAIGLALSVVALALAWHVPSEDLQQRLDDFQDFLASDPLQQVANAWGRVFAPIDAAGLATTDYYGADQLELRGAIKLGDEIVFQVEAPPLPQRYYWRSRVYERYSNGQWSPSADLRITDRAAPVEITMNGEVLGGRRQAVQQRFTIGAANSRIYYAAPQPQRIGGSGKIDLLYTDKPQNSAMNVSVVRPLHVMRQGESYTATSQISLATADELRRAGLAYPAWVSSPNLYVGSPNTRVLELAQRIVAEAGADSPYDRARAIESWLRKNIAYNEAIGAPPANVDVVEWLLFDAQEGYCTYFATAMIIMLRNLGIPARLAAGFSQGELEPTSSQFIVRERDAHAWVEVYFPGYGWINFEPTTSEAPINREGDDDGQEIEDSLTPEATTSPTPEPSPTLAPSPSAAPSEEAAQSFLEEPTPTPTATPTPPPPPATITPTPLI
ncbi:MAG: transglutaminase domain-containing protein [Chloroflexi bacterium]|nr:transglutaminase domain-containing protein [Chloroflexota bacterium]